MAAWGFVGVGASNKLGLALNLVGTLALPALVVITIAALRFLIHFAQLFDLMAAGVGRPDRLTASTTLNRAAFLAAGLALAGCGGGSMGPAAPGDAAGAPTISCFLLSELGVGEIRRAPAVGCAERVTPASTFKIPHALAALDAGVVADASTTFAWDGSPMPFESWERDHTLASAMRSSVVWYFQRVADALGPAREQEYLVRFRYGNQDSSGNPGRFWLEDSLLVSPDEQQRFLLDLHASTLPASASAMRVARDLLVQPRGMITNAKGTRPFDAPWPEGTVVRAKTGNAQYDDGVSVEWLVGSVTRDARTWVFVSCKTGRFPASEQSAVDLASSVLRLEHVL
jgi:beta-lactamase class D